MPRLRLTTGLAAASAAQTPAATPPITDKTPAHD